MSYSIKSTTYPEEIYSFSSIPVVVIQKSWVEHSENEKALLDRILGVAKVSSYHVQLIEQENLDFTKWALKPKKVIAFGLNVPGLTKNEIIEVQDMRVIVTDDLSVLENAEKEKKQKLAAAVRDLFA